MLIKIGVALLVVLALHQTRQLRRIIKMSETFDSELTETEAAISGMTAAVNNAADKFTDLARKLQAAIDALSQQGLSPAQLARFNDIQSHLATEAAALTAAASAADPDPAPPADTVPAGDGDDTIPATGGDDTIPAGDGSDTPTGEDTTGA